MTNNKQDKYKLIIDGSFIYNEKKYLFRVKTDEGSYRSYFNGEKIYRFVEIYDENQKNIDLIWVFCGDDTAVDSYKVQKAFEENLMKKRRLR